MMTTSIKKNTAALAVTCRVIIALLGGFLLANLVGILISFYLHNEQAADDVDGIVAGMMTSFIVYLVAVIFVFSTKSVTRAAVGIGVCCLVTWGVMTTFNMAITR